MAITKIDNYYISDLSWWIKKNYPKARGSKWYYLFKESFEEAMIGVSESDAAEYAKEIIRKTIQMDKIAKFKSDESVRLKAAAQCIAVIDLFS